MKYLFWILLVTANLFGITTIMLDPAGDTKYAGRKLSNTFERGITIQFCEQLKKLLEDEYPYLRIVLSRFPGENLDTLQNASFSNRLDTSLYLSFHFFQETEERPRFYIYHFLYNAITDFWSKNLKSLTLCPYYQAHLLNLNITKEYANKMSNYLKTEKSFDLKGPFGIPIKPLIGIEAPAIAIEVGVKTETDYINFIDPIIKSLRPIINEIN